MFGKFPDAIHNFNKLPQRIKLIQFLLNFLLYASVFPLLMTAAAFNEIIILIILLCTLFEIDKVFFSALLNGKFYYFVRKATFPVCFCVLEIWKIFSWKINNFEHHIQLLLINLRLMIGTSAGLT